MEENENIFFFVNTDRKQFVDVKKVGINHTELDKVLRNGIWSGENIQPLSELGGEFHSFMDISNTLKENDKTMQPYITVEFPDSKTEVITLHRQKKKKFTMDFQSDK